MQNNKMLIQNFEQSYPGFAKDAVTLEVTGLNTVLATFENGTQLEWHRGLNTVCIIQESTPTDEQEWRSRFQYKINKRMSDLNMDIDTLSEETGISVRTIYNYLNAKTTPSCWNIRLIAATLKCDIEDLM